MSTTCLPSRVLALVFLFSISSLTLAQDDTSAECSCFRTNGSSAGYFTSHRFLDYRNVSSASPDVPRLISNLTSTSIAVATSEFFTDDAWNSDWAIQTWNNSDTLDSSGASILMVNSPNNVYIEKSNDTDPSYTSYLTLRTARLPSFQSTAEIDSAELNYHFLSARFHARVTGSPGACAGLFTYLHTDDDPDSVQEADIEILTRDPRNAVQYTNQPSTKDGEDVPKATANATNPHGRDWTQWNTYRLDWMPKRSSWYVNGESVASIGFQTPRDPAGLFVNMWSDGGAWTGNMSVYDEAYLQIQWIEIAYNTSGPYGGPADKRSEGLVKRKKEGCNVVCGVDEQVNVTGTPAVLFTNTGGAALGWKAKGMGRMVWTPVMLLGGAVFGCL